MKNSLRTKFFVLLILLVFVAVAMSTWLQVSSVTSARKDDLESRAIAIGQFIGLQYTEPLLKNNPSEVVAVSTIEYWINQHQRTNAEFLELYNTDGQRLVSYAGPGYDIPNRKTLTSGFIRELLLSDEKLLVRSSPKRQLFDVLVPVALNNTHLGVVRMGLDASGYYQQRNAVIWTNVQYGSFFLLFIALLAYVATPYILGPIRSLSDVARRFGEGDYEVRSTVTAGDELEELSKQFNRMANQIERLIDNLREAGHYHMLFPYIVVPRKLYARISRHLQRNLDVPYVALLMRNLRDHEEGEYLNYVVEGGELTAIKSHEDPPEVLGELVELTKGDESGEIVKRTQKTGELTQVFNRARREELLDSLTFRIEDNQGAGYLVMARDDRSFSDADRRIVTGILDQIETALSNARNFERVLVDERSGLYPRKVMQLALNKSGKFAEDEQLWLVRFGLDEPVVEPTEGDIHLKVARFLNEQGAEISPIEDTDHFIVASHDQSWQFLMVLSGWSRGEAREVIKTILSRIERNEERFPGTSLSAGFTPITPDDLPETVLERGQVALDDARDQGGNTVCFEE